MKSRRAPKAVPPQTGLQSEREGAGRDTRSRKSDTEVPKLEVPGRGAGGGTAFGARRNFIRTVLGAY